MPGCHASPAGHTLDRARFAFREAGPVFVSSLLQTPYIRITNMDEHRRVAHIVRRAAYASEGQPDISIDFEVHYFIRILGGESKILDWVASDEQALLVKHGII